MKKIIKKLEQEIDELKMYKTEHATAYRSGVSFALKIFTEALKASEEALHELLNEAKVPFKIEKDFIKIGNKKYDSRLFQIESFRNEFVHGEIHGYKYIFKTNYPLNIEGAIKSFISERKKTDGLSFTNYCKLIFDMNVDVVWRYNSYNKINKQTKKKS